MWSLLMMSFAGLDCFHGDTVSWQKRSTSRRGRWRQGMRWMNCVSIATALTATPGESSAAWNLRLGQYLPFDFGAWWLCWGIWCVECRGAIGESTNLWRSLPFGSVKLGLSIKHWSWDVSVLRNDDVDNCSFVAHTQKNSIHKAYRSSAEVCPIN